MSKINKRKKLRGNFLLSTKLFAILMLGCTLLCPPSIATCNTKDKEVAKNKPDAILTDLTTKNLTYGDEK